MPIIGCGENVKVEYEIPAKIENKIPPYFYIAFAGELFSIFGLSILQKDEDNCYELHYFCGTAGWEEAFNTTCKKLNMGWLMDYCNTLQWYDSDMFDEIIAERTISNFIDAKPSNVNSYYKFLLQTERIEVAKAMERLTYKSCAGDYGSAKTFDDEFSEKCALRNALGKYEDLGYTPDELKEIIKLESSVNYDK